jgi:hypothetical protein
MPGFRRIFSQRVMCSLAVFTAAHISPDENLTATYEGYDRLEQFSLMPECIDQILCADRIVVGGSMKTSPQGRAGEP